jgi:REP element-mobilizing transposase RayT
MEIYKKLSTQNEGRGFIPALRFVKKACPKARIKTFSHILYPAHICYNLPMEQNKPTRKPMRLPQYDYAQNGAYFVTICTDGRKNLLSSVGAIFHPQKLRFSGTPGSGRPPEPAALSPIGKMVDAEIDRINEIYEHVMIDKYTVMPNHVHMIIIIDSGTIGRPQVAPTVSRIIKQFKGVISKKEGFYIWQRSFHDHIIRNEQEYTEVWDYIDTNPLKWEIDRYYKD